MHLCTPLSLTIYDKSESLPHLSAVRVEHQSSIAAHFGAVLSGNSIMTTSPKSINVKWFFSLTYYPMLFTHPTSFAWAGTTVS